MTQFHISEDPPKQTALAFTPDPLWMSDRNIFLLDERDIEK
jgi:hypothetical protein